MWTEQSAAKVERLKACHNSNVCGCLQMQTTNVADGRLVSVENIRGAGNAEAPGRKEAAGEGMRHGTTHA